MDKRLFLIGTGIKSISHLTMEAQSCIKQSDCVLYLVNEPIISQWIEKYSCKSHSLDAIYNTYPIRKDAYEAITQHILEVTEQYDTVTAVFYGHPTFLASSGLRAIEKAKKNNVITHILPGISAADCLFADLAVDPGERGCYLIEVHDLLLYDKPLIPESDCIICQVGMIGNLGLPSYEVNISALKILLDRLLEIYPENHAVVLYEASLYPNLKPSIQEFPLTKLMEQTYTPITTLYIPACKKAKTNQLMAEKLGLYRQLNQLNANKR